MKKMIYPEKLIILILILLILIMSGISEGTLSGFPLFAGIFACAVGVIRVADCFCVIDRRRFVRLMRQISECVNGCSQNNRSHIDKDSDIRRAA